MIVGRILEICLGLSFIIVAFTWAIKELFDG